MKAARKQERSSFLKKRSKKLLSVSGSIRASPGCCEASRSKESFLKRR
jgi:hypothetical protein